MRLARSERRAGISKRALQRGPDNAAARLLAARLARTAGDFASALSHLDAAIAIAPQRDAFIEKARTLDQAGLRPQARQAWNAILDVIPDHAEAAARSGRLAWEDGEAALALSLLERAAKSDAPAPVWFDLGLARQDLRDHAGAASAYRKAIALKDDHAEAAFNLGVVLQEMGDLDDATRAYAQAYRLRPSSFGQDHDGADLGLARAAVARRGAALRSKLDGSIF